MKVIWRKGKKRHGYKQKDENKLNFVTQLGQVGKDEVLQSGQCPAAQSNLLETFRNLWCGTELKVQLQQLWD